MSSRRALGDLPGSGAVTVGLFHRELPRLSGRAGATAPATQRAADAARHLGLIAPGTKGELARITHLAELAGMGRPRSRAALAGSRHARRRTGRLPRMPQRAVALE